MLFRSLRGSECVGVGFFVRARSNAEETVFGVTSPQSAVFANADPSDIVAHALNFIASVKILLRILNWNNSYLIYYH